MSERPANHVRICEDGPLQFAADMQIVGSGPCSTAELCRCGASRLKPFCDGSHTAAGFRASGEPAPREPFAPALQGGALKISPQKNGPLRVAGPLELISQSGRLIGRGNEVYLCRCGASADKPYCDGSHKGCGFSS